MFQNCNISQYSGSVLPGPVRKHGFQWVGHTLGLPSEIFADCFSASPLLGSKVQVGGPHFPVYRSCPGTSTAQKRPALDGAFYSLLSGAALWAVHGASNPPLKTIL